MQTYQVVITSTLSDGGKLHKVSLYINGYVDLQGSIQNFNAFENA